LGALGYERRILIAYQIFIDHRQFERNQGLDDVTNLYRQSGNEIEKTGAKLDVAASEYSAEKVTAAIDEAKAKAQADASKKAGEAASGAVDSVLGGFNKK
jgi:hypothetical protein